jgi:hypothetical protein
MRESEIERYFQIAVKARGGVCWKWVSPGLRGVPDRVVVLPGNRIFFVELKAPGEVPEPHQARVHKILRGLGAVVYDVDSVEAVDALMRNLS